MATALYKQLPMQQPPLLVAPGVHTHTHAQPLTPLARISGTFAASPASSVRSGVTDPLPVPTSRELVAASAKSAFEAAGRTHTRSHTHTHGVEAQNASQAAEPLIPAEIPDGVIAPADVNAAIAHVAFGLSDAVLTFTSEADSRLLRTWGASRGVNAFGHACVVRPMETRGGAAGAALLGIASAGLLPTAVVGSAASAASMSSSLASLRSAKLPSVLHVHAREVQPDGSVVNAHEALLALARRAGVPMLVSASAQEAHDISVCAYAAAVALRTPVIHAFEDVGVSSTHAHIRLLRYTELKRALHADALASFRSAPTAAVTSTAVPRTLSAVLRETSPLLSRVYTVAEYTGNARPEVLFSAVGVTALLANTWCAQQSDVPVGCLRFFAPLGGLASDVTGVLPKGFHAVVALSSAAVHAEDTWRETLASTLRYSMVNAPVSAWKLPVPTFASVGAGIQAVMQMPVSPSPSSAEGSGVSRYALFNAASDAARVVAEVAFDVAAELRGVTVAAADTRNTLHNDAFLSTTRITTLSGADAGAETTALVHDSDDVVVIGHTSVTSRISTLASLRLRGKVIVSLTTEGPEAFNTKAAAQRVAEAFTPSEIALLISRRAQVFALPTVALAARLQLDGPLSQLPLLVATFVAAAGASFVHTARFLEQRLKAVVPPEQHAAIARLFSATKQSLMAVPLVQDAGTLASTACVTEPARVEAGKPLPSVPRWSHVASTLDVPAGLGPTEWRSHEVATAAPGVAHVSAVDRAVQAIVFPTAYSTALVPRADGEAAAPVALSGVAASHDATTAAAHGHEVLYTPVVSVNRRLTPLDYDRNVFHVEFDITGTGLVYSIGSALAVYAANRDDETHDFLSQMRIDPDAVVELPAVGKQEGAVASTQTAYRAFKRELDVFGEPSKEFYEALIPYALDFAQRQTLARIASDAGIEEFARRSTEAYTYADILYEFTSARPPLAELVRLIPRIRPRHYSIASSQRMHPNSVHLLVVEVAWTTPGGRQRRGQCSHFLANVPVGERVTVAVITSEMHLPTDPLAPVVMAGLGTGMAPFRAFIEERAALRAAGYAVGPMVLYFGARHRHQEYLYGDELDRYADEGIISKGSLRLAFSRDTAKKVYIQHLMNQDGGMLWHLLRERAGSFYLCGPTWPEPDVEEAITTAFMEHGSLDQPGAKALIKFLKESKRYVLEVY